MTYQKRLNYNGSNTLFSQDQDKMNMYPSGRLQFKINNFIFKQKMLKYTKNFIKILQNILKTKL